MSLPNRLFLLASLLSIGASWTTSSDPALLADDKHQLTVKKGVVDP